ncbi:pimeloyl-ACP methyl ester carboxylesterase [Luteibacter rhizovicinus]|uniref:Pimeloyl-ACP methyl ester carboxylesterase n=1 Tax=Luteibacter rhizovicinus TaxID=242606 RepID=A0A4V2W3K6_9GAMM|nr:alpha/beta hydrolase [Luteibacter rhizovicinus]TCV92309.1 pimeloyl-ACP methyl ester carboxylesterase [Luteibacter rhizovicinus]
MSHRIALRLVAFAMACWAASTLHAAISTPAAPSGEYAAGVTDSFQVGTLKVQRYGHGGRPIILIPGLSSGAWVWKSTIESLSKTDTVYAVTLAGFDGTPAPAGDESYMDRADASLLKLIKERDLKHAVIVGHSIGGTIALRFAGQHPDAVAGIVAVDGLPIFPGMDRVPAEQRAAIAANLKTKAEAATQEEYQAQSLAYMQKIGTVDPAVAAHYAPLSARSDVKAVARYMAEDAGGDFRPVLKSATMPILEIAPYNAADSSASKTGMTEAQKIAYYRSLLVDAPHAKVVSIGPSRHFVMLDQPEAFQKTLAGFIGTL